jgi:hypothetical protein
MRTSRLESRVVLVVATVAVAAGGTAIGIAATRHEPQALLRAPKAGDALPPQAARFLHPGASRRVAAFRSSGSSHAVFVNRSQDGSQICVWDTELASGAQAGGCNPSDDFFAGHAFTVSLAYDGGPAVADVHNARIVGIVSGAVASIEVVYTDRSSRRVAITPDRAFAHAVPNGALRGGVAPLAVVARNAAGDEIDRQETRID